MWPDGAVDTADRCRGKDGFFQSGPAKPGAGGTSTWAGLTRALALSQGRKRLPHPPIPLPPLHTEAAAKAAGLSHFTTVGLFYMADLQRIALRFLFFLKLF